MTKAYASFDAASVAFRAQVGPERVDFYTGATGKHFCCLLTAREVLAASVEDGVQAGRLFLHGWQVRDLKARLRDVRDQQARRSRLSALAG